MPASGLARQPGKVPAIGSFNQSTKSATQHSVRITALANKELQMNDTTMTKQILLTRRSPAYWRVTIDHPPLNIFGPDTIPQLNEAITAVENDEHVKVVVFDSAIPGFFLTHYDFLAKIEDTTSLPPGPTGLQPLPDMLVRLSRAPVVSIASIRGARPVSEASLPLPATCVLQAAKKQFCRTSKLALVLCPAVAQWHGCRV